MLATAAAPQLMGVRVRRREDPALITGEGKYTGDLHLDGMVSLAVVRSPYPHARIRAIDTSTAKAMPGVLAVLTGAELNPQIADVLPVDIPVTGPGYRDGHAVPRTVLATTKVRCVGDPLAVVVAEDRYLAADAADAVIVDYEPLPGVSDPEAALTPNAPLLYEEWGTNQAFRWENSGGDVDGAFAKAATIVELRLVNQRLIPSAMEPRAVVARYDPATDGITIWTSTQIPHGIKNDVAPLLGMAPDQIRVIAPEVGGGFGAKSNVYAEEVIVPFLAKYVGRPVKWVATRGEDYLTTSHGRDQINIVRLAADRNGRIHAVDLTVIANCGAYYSRVMPAIPTLTALMMTGVYDIPNARCAAIGVMTNKGINEPYRGAGRPEAAYMIERAIDLLADELDLDPVVVRQHNFIPSDQFPYRAPLGANYDSGDYATNLKALLSVVDYPALRAEQTKRRSEGGKLMGIGLATYVEICGFDPSESAVVTVDQAAKVTVLSGTSPHGQGHKTAWTQIVADMLQIPPEDITVIHNDTALVPKGFGTYGSRSAAMGGSAVWKNSETVREQAKQVAAHLLEAAVADVTLENGRFSVVGSPAIAVSWQAVAAAVHQGAVPTSVPAELSAGEDFASADQNYPFGAHLAVIEIEPATGQIEIVRYVTMDDCGRVINPMLVEGQVHGGIAQGVGQALLENAAYDESGNLLSGSLMDYNLPRADNFPHFETNRTETPSPLNPLGVKGIGEAATIGSTPTIVNAVVDALSHLGVRHLDMPLTPEKIWRALHGL
ncbi:MAG: xanthine dehydrogenase family protein molybdopterin-binding subunit [Caldilineaceae bacterium]|nr:xanthine dehydrogenase family protein molybdopterin-binding subunit [Caldilineaceae bacterium]